MKKALPFILLILGGVLILIAAAGYYRFNFTGGGDEITACTEEAMLCPDGSAVGREGPNCEFAPCPTESQIENPQTENPSVNGTNSTMTESDARAIAQSTCIKGGEALGAGYYNENSKTWWFDANLNATQQGCNPACVVSEDTKTAEINWRCTGAIPSDNQGGVTGGAGALPPAYLSQMDSCTSDGGTVEKRLKDMGSWTAVSSWQCVCSASKTTFGAENLACNTWFTLIAD